MKLNRFLLYACAMIFVFSVTGWAQVREGLTELNLSGAYSEVAYDGKSTYSVYLNTSAGYFLFTNLELGADFSLTKLKKEDTIGSAGPFVSFHYPFSEDAAVVPLIGVQGGSTFGFEENQYYWGGFLGCKAFIGEGGGGAVSLQAFYLRFEPSEETKPFNHFGVLTGISIFF